MGIAVLVAGFPAGSFAANCYVVAPGPGEECVVIDTGQDASAGVDEIVREHRLKPIAVLLTHGHFDHTLSVVPVCGARGIPAYIHPDDREMLADPGKGLSLAANQELFGGLEVGEPDEVRELSAAEPIEVGGLSLTVSHAPGHTRGSVTFGLTASEETPDILFTGDLLFAGSIGRTDLPGGDHATILKSLAAVCLPLADATVVLPGHGDQTTIGRERATNPFLAGLAGESGGAAPASGPTRGL